MPSSSPFPPCWAASRTSATPSPWRRGQGRRTILFVDEVHRFNKAQQDAFLPYVESGLFTFIGATTENPSFEVNSALLSRARVYVLQSLTPEELQLLVDRAIAAFNDGLEAGAAMRVEPDAREQLAAWADGDARRLISAVEVVAESAQSAGRDSVDAAGWKSRYRRTCGASTRAATPSTTRSAPCTRRCAARIRTRRCTGSAA